LHTRLVIEILVLGYFGFGILLGYLATSGAEDDIIFLLGNPDFI